MKSWFFVFLIFTSATLPAQEHVERTGSFDADLQEISGLQFIKGKLYAQNDGGNPPKIFLIDTFANIIKSYDTDGVNVDWEDLASDGDSLLFIGDIGNNDNSRKNLKIYVTNLNQIQGNMMYLTGYPFVYENQTAFPPDADALYFDCEAMLYAGGLIHLFTKNRTKPYDGKMFHYTFDIFNDADTARLVDIVNIGGNIKELWWITAADINRQTNEVVMLSSDKYFVFTMDSSFHLTQKAVINLGDISQKEGICFDANNNIWVCDEANTISAGLYRIKPGSAFIQKFRTKNLKAKVTDTILEVNLPEPDGLLLITDGRGTEIFRRSIGSETIYQIGIENWAAGTYFVKFVTKHKIYQCKKAILK